MNKLKMMFSYFLFWARLQNTLSTLRLTFNIFTRPIKVVGSVFSEDCVAVGNVWNATVVDFAYNRVNSPALQSRGIDFEAVCVLDGYHGLHLFQISIAQSLADQPSHGQ